MIKNKKMALNRIWVFLLIIFLISCGQHESEVNKLTQGQEEEDSWVKNPPLWSKSANVYEVNIRQYTPEGTFRAFMPHLERLQELGVDILCFMPIHPIGELHRKGELGNFYSVKDYRSINPEFGNLEDFKNVVKKVHALNMKVIIDWVPNCTAWDNPFTSNTNWYVLDESGDFVSPPESDWDDVIQLDFSNNEMRQTMIDAMKYWIESCNIDGFRCDLAGRIPLEFWVECRKQLDKLKDIFFLAEWDEPWCHNAFDVTYARDIHSAINEVAKGNKSLKDLIALIELENTRYERSAYRIHFTTDHYENSLKGTVRERMGNGGEAYFLLSSTIPGMPMIYNGQEAGLNRRLKLYEKDEINWRDLSHSVFFKKILALKHDHSSLWNGEFGGKLVFNESDNEHVIFFSRISENDNIHVIINLSSQPQKISLDEFKINKWDHEVLDGVSINISSDGIAVMLQPWGYSIFSS